jgi:hypothetical protein
VRCWPLSSREITHEDLKSHTTQRRINENPIEIHTIDKWRYVSPLAFDLVGGRCDSVEEKGIEEIERHELPDLCNG